MKIDFKALALLVFVFVISLKGGDSPSPSPSDVLAAQKAGEAYLRGLAELYETIEFPESEAEFAKQLNEKHREIHNQSFIGLDMRWEELEYPDGVRESVRDMAKGFRGVVE